MGILEKKLISTRPTTAMKIGNAGPVGIIDRREDLRSSVLHVCIEDKSVLCNSGRRRTSTWRP